MIDYDLIYTIFVEIINNLLSSQEKTNEED